MTYCNLLTIPGARRAGKPIVLIVYDSNTLTIHSSNKNPEYYFEVEAFDNGTDYYRERTQKTLGRGAEIELSKGGAAQMGGMFG